MDDKIIEKIIHDIRNALFYISGIIYSNLFNVFINDKSLCVYRTEFKIVYNSNIYIMKFILNLLFQSIENFINEMRFFYTFYVTLCHIIKTKPTDIKISINFSM